MKIGIKFHVVVVQWRQRNVQIACSTGKVVVFLSKPITFLLFLLPSPSSLLTLSITSPDRANCRQSMRIFVFLQMFFLFFNNFYNLNVGLPKLQNN